MTETIVRDRFQRIIGYIEQTPSEQIARDMRKCSRLLFSTLSAAHSSAVRSNA